MTRIFENMSEALEEIERDIMEMGIKVHPHTMQNKAVKHDKDYETLEVQNYSFTILDLSDKNEMIDNFKWCEAEFEERVATNPDNPGEAWKLRREVWEEFLTKEGKFDYTYAKRFSTHLQVSQVIAELSKNPDSRQCIIHVNFPKDCKVWQKNRIPCSMYYQFMIRRGKLDIIYNMRSSDFYSHFKNDIWLADQLRKYISIYVGVETGLFHMNVGSLHAYKGYGHKGKHIF